VDCQPGGTTPAAAAAALTGAGAKTSAEVGGNLACALGCAEHEAVLAESFEPWWDHQIPAGTLLEACKQAQQWALSYIGVVSSGRIFSRCCSASVCDPKEGDQLLKTVAELAAISQWPDMYFLFNTGDQPFTDKAYWLPVPQFHWVKSAGHWGIPLPNPFHLQAHWDRELGDSTRHEAFLTPWDQKMPKVFWRGTLSAPDNFLEKDLLSLPRVRLLEISRQHPDLFDVAVTGIDEDMYNHGHSKEAIDEVLGRFPIGDHLDQRQVGPRFRYLINVAAVLSSWRLVQLMASGSVLLLQDDMTKEVMYDWLTPWVHFVPVSSTLSDLVGKVQWLEENQDVAQRIAANGLDLFRKRIRRQDTYCYIWQVFNTMADVTEREAIPSPKEFSPAEGWKETKVPKKQPLQELLKQVSGAAAKQEL